MSLLSAEEERQRQRWGWIAVIHLESGGPWVPARDAARMVGVSTANLRRWAQRGVISVIRDPGHHSHYYLDELRLITQLAEAQDEPASLTMLIKHLAIVLASAYDST
ncbi:hypothetical protein GCM10022254_36140 [Actinomadura meridiana]|uniref:HTH merR-type domain-containing protein n=1 Tax=Actinomadura meridiana TaxID=559626 RepID=A0ABP8C4F6_9ACTN